MLHWSSLVLLPEKLQDKFSDMSSAEELAKEYEEGLGDDINPGTGG